MKINLKTDYALRVLIFLQSHEKATIKEIAEHYEIKKNHLSVVANVLSEHGYIKSTTGPTGGISLNSSTLNKTVAEIILLFEDLNLVQCFDPKTNQCKLSPSCKLKSILKKANKQFIDTLRSYTIKDLKM